MPTIGGFELVIVLVIVLLLFGAKKLPDLAGSMGKSIKVFRKAAAEADTTDGEETGEAERRPSDTSSA